MGLFSELFSENNLDSYARNINPAYKAKKEAEEFSQAYSQASQGQPEGMSPINLAHQLMQSGAGGANKFGQQLYSNTQANKPKEAKINDYIDSLPPKKQAEWFERNPTIAPAIVQQMFTDENGYINYLTKSGTTVNTGKKSRTPRELIRVGDQWLSASAYGGAREVVSPEQTRDYLQGQAEAKGYGASIGKSEAEKKAAYPQSVLGVNIGRKTAGNVQMKVTEAMDLVNQVTAGLAASGVKIGEWSIPDLRSVGGYGARDLAATLETIKANLGFDRLQQMREMSKTGGALGQVTEKELDRLEASIASLDQGQSMEQLIKNLEAITRHYNGAINLIEKMHEQKYGEKAPDWQFVEPKPKTEKPEGWDTEKNASGQTRADIEAQIKAGVRPKINAAGIPVHYNRKSNYGNID